MEKFEKGQFVRVGESVGVIVELSNGTDIPDDHLAVWYGQTTKENGDIVPLIRTVPEEYCKLIDAAEYYH